MAIVIEEGKKRTDIFAIGAWLVFLALVAGAVYYIFFAQPELVVIPETGTLSNIAPITQLSLNPQSIVQGSIFQTLHSTIALPSPQGPAAVGRTNPFIAP